LKNLFIFKHDKETYKLYIILIFHLAPALNHVLKMPVFQLGLKIPVFQLGLKMPVLANTLFGPQISFSQHFEQRNCSFPRFCMTHSS